MSAQLCKKVTYILSSLFLAIWLSACATTAPVQEMSNARQTIAAAHEVKAKIYAPEQIQAAERLMEQATGALESGDYHSAREYAVAAQQQAIKARQSAVAQQK